MDIRDAEFVRWVSEDEPVRELISYTKGETWRHAREYGLVKTFDNRLMLIRGGRDGIRLSLLEQNVGLFVEGGFVRIVRLEWHIHPRVTGPSDSDRQVLEVLDQQYSKLFEIGAGSEATIFRRGKP